MEGTLCPNCSEEDLQFADKGPGEPDVYECGWCGYAVPV